MFRFCFLVCEELSMKIKLLFVLPSVTTNISTCWYKLSVWMHFSSYTCCKHSRYIQIWKIVLGRTILYILFLTDVYFQSKNPWQFLHGANQTTLQIPASSLLLPPKMHKQIQVQESLLHWPRPKLTKLNWGDSHFVDQGQWYPETRTMTSWG